MKLSLEKKLCQLPPEYQDEVEDFVGFLLKTKGVRKQKKLRLSWAGGLKEFRDKFSAFELQKKSLEWWGH